MDVVQSEFSLNQYIIWIPPSADAKVIQMTVAVV